MELHTINQNEAGIRLGMADYYNGYKMSIPNTSMKIAGESIEDLHISDRIPHILRGTYLTVSNADVTRPCEIIGLQGGSATGTNEIKVDILPIQIADTTRDGLSITRDDRDITINGKCEPTGTIKTGTTVTHSNATDWARLNSFTNSNVSSTVEGTFFTLTDASSTKQASITELKGNTTQEGTPTPSNPIEVSTVSGDNNILINNKNWCFTNAEEWESGHYVEGSGGKGIDNYRARLKKLLPVRPHTTYYLHTNNSNFNFVIRVYDKNKDYLGSLGGKANGSTITTTTYAGIGECYLGVSIYAPNTSTSSSAIIEKIGNGEIKPFICLNNVTDKSYVENNSNYYKVSLNDSGSILPTEYQEVEYIQANGTQFINTNTTVKTNTRVVMDFDCDSGKNGKWLLGSRATGGHTSSFGLYLNSATQYWCQVGGNTSTTGGYATVTSVFGRHLLDLSGTSFKVDNVELLTYTNNLTNGAQPIAVFTLRDASAFDNRYAFGKLYSFKIYEGDTLVRNLVPCYKKTTGVIGLYDTVNDTFMLNEGTGTFTKGTDVFHNYLGIELNKIGNYQDKLYYDSGKWYIEKNIGKVVLNGSESYSYGAGTKNTLLKDIGMISANVETTGYVKCNYYEEKGNASADSVDYAISRYGATGTYNYQKLVFKNKDITSASAFKTWLTNNNTTVYYVLATPTYTEITDTYLLEQLNGLLDIELYENLCYVDWIGIEKPTTKLFYNYLKLTGTHNLTVRKADLVDTYPITFDGDYELDEGDTIAFTNGEWQFNGTAITDTDLVTQLNATRHMDLFQNTNYITLNNDVTLTVAIIPNSVDFVLAQDENGLFSVKHGDILFIDKQGYGIKLQFKIGNSYFTLADTDGVINYTGATARVIKRILLTIPTDTSISNDLARFRLYKGTEADNTYPITLGSLVIGNGDYLHNEAGKWKLNTTEITDSTLLANLRAIERLKLYDGETNYINWHGTNKITMILQYFYKEGGSE